MWLIQVRIMWNGSVMRGRYWPAEPRIIHVAVCFAPKIQSGGESGEQAAGVRLEFVASNLNSTNLTQIAYGIAGNVAAVLLYGTNFVPVKRIETGDGKHSLCYVY